VSQVWRPPYCLVIHIWSTALHVGCNVLITFYHQCFNRRLEADRIREIAVEGDLGEQSGISEPFSGGEIKLATISETEELIKKISVIAEAAGVRCEAAGGGLRFVCGKLDPFSPPSVCLP